MQNGPLHRDVLQLLPVHRAAEQQPSPAHVPAGDKVPRKLEARAEPFEQHLQVFVRGDAAQEDDLGVRTGTSREPAGVARERPDVGGDVFPDFRCREEAKVIGRNPGLRGNEAAAWE